MAHVDLIRAAPLPLTRQRGTDALPVLIVYVVALYGIPSQLIVHPLGAAGTPAQILGNLLLAWWLASQLILLTRPQRPNPVHWLLLLFVVAILASYVAGMTRPIVSSLEVNSSDRAILSMCSWCGVALVVSDGITTRARLETLVRVIAGGAAVIAALGCLQFFFGLDLAHYIRIPGLSVNNSFGDIFDRSGYRRVSGTTAHPIEFGVVLAALLPLVIHCARFARTRRAARWWWAAVLVVAAALPLSVARSGIIGGAIALLYLFHTWPRSLQRRAAAVGAAGAVLMSAVVPGLLGTIKSLFLNAGSDPSTQGRTADYAPVLSYVEHFPLLGRGYGTFIPDLYRTLDNQYLGLLVETGILGVVAFLALVCGTVIVAGRIRRASRVARTRDLAQCLKAGIVVIAVDAATFDAFGFAVCVGTLFLLIGIVAMLCHVGNDEAPEVDATRRRIEPRATPGRSGRMRLAPVVLTVLLAACVGAALFRVATAKEEYRASGSVLFVPPQGADQTAFSRSGNATSATSVLHDILDTPEVHDSVGTRTGGQFQVAVGDGSLMAGTDVDGFGPTLTFAATGPTPTAAGNTLADVVQQAREQLATLQETVGVPSSEAIVLRVVDSNQVHPVSGRRSRAAGAGLFLASLLSVVAFLSMSSRARRRVTWSGRTLLPHRPLAPHRPETHHDE